MYVSENMSQPDRCELFGTLIDTVEDWLEEKGIKPEDISNPEREDGNSVIIYGDDYDYLANSFSEILGIARDIDEEKFTSPLKGNANTLIEYADSDEDFEENFGDIVYSAFMDSENSLEDISDDILAVFSSCKTENELKLADNMLIAITGYSLDSLLKQYERNFQNIER